MLTGTLAKHKWQTRVTFSGFWETKRIISISLSDLVFNYVYEH